MSCLRILGAGLSQLKLGFDPRSVHVRSVVDRVAVGQDFHGALRVFSVSIIPPLLHTRPTSTCCSEKNKRTKRGNLPKSSALSAIGEHCIEKHFHFFIEKTEY